MEKILRTIRNIIPTKIFKFFQPAYHYLLALVGATIYGFPARKLFIIGVTGTKGKTTTTEIISSILDEAGYKTALCNTIRFKIGKESISNKYRMSMPGRFFVQNFLHRAAKAGCTHVVVEITSEGSKQFRSKFVWLDAFVFTNLAPEHIESHGSYEKYKEAKLRIADLTKKKGGMIVVNGDDEESEAFLKRTDAEKKIKYSLSDAKPIVFGHETEMRFKRTILYSKLPGEFNVYNILAAATVTDALGISVETIKKAVENVAEIPGRTQKVDAGQNFEVMVDYAHTIESLEKLYKTFENKNKICVLGNTGGGRDKWKRPVMAKIAEKYCSEIILTNEDPFDEDPEKIIREMSGAMTQKKPKIILDRREAIRTAVKDAKKNDLVLITGKGTEPYITGANGQRTNWSDFEVAKEELKKMLEK